MQRLQRTLTVTWAAATLLGGLAFSAQAEPTAAASAPTPSSIHAHGQRHHTGPKDPAQHQAQRAQHLSAVLQLQPSQKTALDAYIAATAAPVRTAKAPGERHSTAALTTPERIQHAQQLRKARQLHAEQREKATLNFYESLNRTQQQAFDALTQRHTQRHAGPHHAGKRHSHPADAPVKHLQAPTHP